MRFGTTQFPGEKGKHRNPKGQDCPGRGFKVKVLGSGGIYTNEVECMTCHKGFEATQDELVHEAHKSVS
jgi:hypothetical protein